MERRVVVTGMGAITPVGNDTETFFDNLKKGVLGIDFIENFDTSGCKVKIAGMIKDFKPEEYVQKKEVKRCDAFSLFGIAAATQAVLDSKIDLDKIDRYRFGVMVGSGIGGLRTIQDQGFKLLEKGEAKISPLFIPTAIINMAAGNIAIKFGAKAICTTAVTACATGTNCIGDAYRSIKHGYMDYCLAGGTEAPVTLMGLAGFTNLTALTKCNDPKRASIPFDKERSGFVIAEGAGVLMLEDLDHALARGAEIHGEIVGYGATCDAYHMTAPAPHGEGAYRAMKMAMDEANIKPSEVGYINAHGTSTQLNDIGETIAIKLAFGDLAPKIPISSIKSMTGHLLGATGAIEAIACIKAMQDGFIPPTIGYKVKDEECDLDYVPNVGRKADVSYSISNSLGFGGHNVVLCFKKYDGK